MNSVTYVPIIISLSRWQMPNLLGRDLNVKVVDEEQ